MSKQLKMEMMFVTDFRRNFLPSKGRKFLKFAGWLTYDLTDLLVNSKLVFGSCDWSERTELCSVAQLAHSNSHRHCKTTTKVAAASKRQCIAQQCTEVFLKLFYWLATSRDFSSSLPSFRR